MVSGSAAHYEGHTVAETIAAETIAAETIAAEVQHRPLQHQYHGRVTCFLETGHGQATFLWFDYDHPPKASEVVTDVASGEGREEGRLHDFIDISFAAEHMHCLTRPGMDSQSLVIRTLPCHSHEDEPGSSSAG